jgi:predicted Fe-S protein YdhL (DUF1289 family)
MTMTGTTDRTVLSPCIRVCVVDAASGLCAGCGRTLAEIGAWLALSEAAREAVMAALPARLALLARHGPALPGAV